MSDLIAKCNKTLTNSVLQQFLEICPNLPNFKTEVP